jgi:hypothetical protein
MSENRAIQVRLSDRLRSQLEREAARRGLRGTEFVRLLIVQGCNGEADNKEAVNAG